MKLQFDKSGRRFFFLTFCVRGRRAVLSRIVKKPGKDGKPTNVVLSTLKLNKPMDPEFYKYLTGKAEL